MLQLVLDKLFLSFSDMSFLSFYYYSLSFTNSNKQSKRWIVEILTQTMGSSGSSLRWKVARSDSLVQGIKCQHLHLNHTIFFLPQFKLFTLRPVWPYMTQCKHSPTDKKKNTQTVSAPRPHFNDTGNIWEAVLNNKLNFTHAHVFNYKWLLWLLSLFLFPHEGKKK